MRKGRASAKITLIGLAALAVLLVLSAACSKKAEPTAAAAEQVPTVKEGSNEFQGAVKFALGKYVYIPAAQGFDIVVAGQVNTAALIGKEAKVKGLFDSKRPTILVAETIEVKEGGSYKPFYSQKAAPNLQDYLDPASRDAYEALKGLVPNKPEGWEGKAKIKVYGRLVQGEPSGISMSDENGKETGKIVVDAVSEYAQYYIKKLRLFDKFWFYLNAKESIDAKSRVKTKELFRADIVFVGLF
ncbi:MAG: hypothetical protein MUQ00_03780 [Candidatus Aminicenantes bacterium]|jgi:hypothetical protein|nr:hypothetical protein [Candidatus Aminicenantes bacterium]